MGFNLKIVGGTSNIDLSYVLNFSGCFNDDDILETNRQKVAQFLQIDLTETKVHKFADSEIGVQIMENVRGVSISIGRE